MASDISIFSSENIDSGVVLCSYLNDVDKEKRRLCLILVVALVLGNKLGLQESGVEGKR